MTRITPDELRALADDLDRTGQRDIDYEDIPGNLPDRIEVSQAWKDRLDDLQRRLPDERIGTRAVIFADTLARERAAGVVVTDSFGGEDFSAYCTRFAVFTEDCNAGRNGCRLYVWEARKLADALLAIPEVAAIDLDSEDYEA